VAALAAVQTWAPGGFRAGAAPAASSCIPSGTDANINAALVGSGAQAVLCPGAVFSLANSVTFTAPNQEIYTQGMPTDSTRAILRVTGSNLTTAISGNNQSGVTVENIQVDGNRPALGLLTGGALLEMGGGGTGQTVQNITAHDTRSWSDMHFIEGTVTNSVPQCQKATIQNNTIGPSGTATPDAPGNSTWADGISLACGNSMVQGNTIQDATDGGIVVFGAPGSTIQNNTIIAKSQLLFGGINMVDYAPMNGNYTGTVVTHNTIDAAGAFIKIGIAMGQQVWNCTTGTNYGGTVTDNTLEGPYMGYGYAVNGVTNWTVTGNVDNSTHVGTQTAGGCFGSPPASQPAGFQVENATSSNLQSQFTSAVLTNALGTLNSPPISSGPTLSASPTSLSFGNQNVGTTGDPRSVNVTNNGSSAVSVSSITASGDYAETNNCGSSIAAGASCTVSVTFSPTASGTRAGSVTVTSSAVNSPTTISLTGNGVTPSSNLALNQPITASGSQGGFPPTNANDGNTSSYWESTNNAFPQWLQVDLGSAQSIGKIVLDLPPSSAWGARTQTLSVLGSTDGSTFTTIVPSAGYTFDPNTGNTATISFSAATARYVRLNFTANTGWPAAQVSEFQVYAASGGGTPSAALTTSPSSVSFGNQAVGTTSSSQAVTVTNTGSAAASISSIAASGDFAQTNACGNSLAAGASCTMSVTFTPTATGTRTGAVTITSNATTSPNTVSLTGTGTSSNPNLALNQPATASGWTQNYVPANAVDGNTSTYWESTDNAFPQWLQVDLGSAHSIGRIVLNLPPSSAWGTRTQTLSVLGSTDGSTFTTIVGSAGYTFNPSTGNTVTITFASATTRYVRLNFTANTGWPAGQASEFAVYAQ
jgi:parallel beta-helix repeat protein